MSKIVWKNLLDDMGNVSAPFDTILAFRIDDLNNGAIDSMFPDGMFQVVPGIVVWEDESDEYGGRCFRYPLVTLANNLDDILPEDMGDQHKWCLWSEYIKAVGDGDQD